MRHLFTCVLLFITAACSSAPLDGGGGSGAGDGPSTGSTSTVSTDAASSTTDASTGSVAPGCVRNEVALTVTLTEDGFVDTQVVPVTFQGVAGWLALDTGAWTTLVFGKPGDPQYVEHYGDASIGCEIIPVGLLTMEALEVEMFEGKPIFGVLGLDFFTERPAEVDYPGGKVVRYVAEAPVTESLVAVAADYGGERVVLDAVLDEVPLRLMLDTGAPHTIHVGAMAQPGDEEVHLGTADGEATVAYEGPSTLQLGEDAPRMITVWRAPTFPYVEEELMELEAQGLLGASGLGFRRVLFDHDAATLWLGPLAAMR